MLKLVYGKVVNEKHWFALLSSGWFKCPICDLANLVPGLWAVGTHCTWCEHNILTLKEKSSLMSQKHTENTVSTSNIRASTLWLNLKSLLQNKNFYSKIHPSAENPHKVLLKPHVKVANCGLFSVQSAQCVVEEVQICYVGDRVCEDM